MTSAVLARYSALVKILLSIIIKVPFMTSLFNSMFQRLEERENQIGASAKYHLADRSGEEGTFHPAESRTTGH